MAPAHLSIQFPLFSRAGRQSPASHLDNDNDSDGSSKRSSKRSSIRFESVALPKKQGRPLSLPLLNDAGNPKQNSITHGTLKHRTDGLLAIHPRSPLSAIEDVVERPGAPVPSDRPRRRSQTVPVGLPLHILRDFELDEDITPRSAARYSLFPKRVDSPDSFLDSPTPTGPEFKRMSSPLPPQMPLTDRQRHALPRVPAQQLELVKKDNAQLQEMLVAANSKVNQIMGNLTAEEIRSEELETRSRRLEATLKVLTSQQESMMIELNALRTQLSTQSRLPPQSVTPPRRSSKRPKGTKENILDSGTVQLEIALRASKLSTVTSSDSGSNSNSNEDWIHPAHRSNTASVRTSSDEEARPSIATVSSDDSSDLSFSNLTASEIEKFCAQDSPSSGPEFWDPSYYEGATVAPLSVAGSRLSEIDPLTIITQATPVSEPSPPGSGHLELLALKSRFLALSPIPGTPEAKTASPLRGPSPVLKLNTNLTPRQRGIRVAGVVPAPPHRPSNVHHHTSHLRGRSSISNASGGGNNGSPLVRPSGPRPSYAARKMSMQGHLVQTLQPSPENVEKEREMKGMYRPERRPSSIVRGLAAQGFGMGANGAPLGMVRRSSYAGGHSRSSSGTGTSSLASGGGRGSVMEIDSEGMILAPPPRRASSAWSSACSPKTLKEHYKWVESGRGVEMAG